MTVTQLTQPSTTHLYPPGSARPGAEPAAGAGLGWLTATPTLRPRPQADPTPTPAGRLRTLELLCWAPSVQCPPGGKCWVSWQDVLGLGWKGGGKRELRAIFPPPATSPCLRVAPQGKEG